MCAALVGKEVLVKERPILMSGPMVRAILDGRKTQTRRVVKPQPTFVNAEALYVIQEFPDEPHREIDCPYGKVGDRLWVKETFCTPFTIGAPGQGQKIRFRASHVEDGFTYKWRPSIFMPRWASRITLEIVSVRVERLQHISEEDAIAEGVEPLRKLAPQMPHHWKSYRLSGDGTFCEATAWDSYRTLWESINGNGSWAANPWVWVVEFKRVESEVAA